MIMFIVTEWKLAEQVDLVLGTCVKLGIKEQVLEIGMNPESLLIIKRIIVDTDKRYRKNIRQNNGGHVSFQFINT